ncbi:hypothetical protein E6Q11_04155 [Candidatus Dojkabacteria bacterium]|jgi:hypothetical protein|uniref:Uncharacterized protein n=1 Tax=Candidatus Dojkabacteria bacterium TaxID=2099670 RepID=A0A5C7J5K9_9BACT|nr:MAG: hypothetical protein E6Q11_04155 [Candidatus Dojkabacteria bacterium]
MKLSKKQRELICSKTYREIRDVAKVNQSTIKRMRDRINDMKVGTLEKILKQVWGMDLKEFLSIE